MQRKPLTQIALVKKPLYWVRVDKWENIRKKVVPQVMRLSTVQVKMDQEERVIGNVGGEGSDTHPSELAEDLNQDEECEVEED
jgi:hypothetical protein